MLRKKTSRKNAIRFITTTLLLTFFVNLMSIGSIAVTPRWTSIATIDLCIGFDGTLGNVSAVVTKQSTATSVEGTVTLYELVDDEWSYVGEWYNSKSRGTLVVSGDFACQSGVTYKAVLVVTAYTGATPETETVEYIDECP